MPNPALEKYYKNAGLKHNPLFPLIRLLTGGRKADLPEQFIQAVRYKCCSFCVIINLCVKFLIFEMPIKII
ncbi:MAG: hypothetical protein AUK34_10205 [Ignavibacteria bacterium CG2_30_36_16]|nr:MAG: hypothetical protein AUK34_10205 [Ignavibacteria bacterium CG2_30_36_16]PJB00719.1 MAG: hypothetical protein CO127_07575 [Ignavibacteria bacterium CG_4_9_14_3_um_filter_36_18]